MSDQGQVFDWRTFIRDAILNPVTPDEERDAFRKILHEDVDAVIEYMKDASGKVVLNSDDLFHLYPPYAQNSGERIRLGPLLYPVAREFTDRLFLELLANEPPSGANIVVFTAGGSATGKSTILRSVKVRDDVAFVVDTTFSNTERACAQVEAVLRSGRFVEIQYIYRDFRESVLGMVQRAKDPESGRIVPIDDLARTHFGSQRAVLAVWELYGTNSEVSIFLNANRDNELIALSEIDFLQVLHLSIDVLCELGETLLNELRETSQGSAGSRFNARDDSRGRDLQITEAFYEAARSRATGKRPGPA